VTALGAEAFAKINRELRVGSRRPDGFHEILSRFSSIDLSDRIEVEEAEELELVCEGRESPSDETNLVLRSARALAAELAIAPRARIRLNKRIPIGAGLGGGSSDAAVSLLLLRALWAPGLPDDRLAAIATRLGSDVPYFLTGGEADVSGRGEKVTPREDGPPAELLLIVPPFGASTRAVCDALSIAAPRRDPLPERLVLVSSGRFFGPNGLALPLLVVRPAMKAYLESAAQAAAEFGVSGSGSTVVLSGVKPGAESWLAQRHPEASIQRTRTLGRGEYGERTLPTGGFPWTSHR
jgi:4-diphosphocytidyl-2-C-methyl-D-erythritol kinase